MGSTGHPRNNHFYDCCRLCGCLVGCKDGSQSLRYQANSSWHARYLWLRLSFRPIPSWTNDDHVGTEQLTCLKGTYFSPTHNSYSHRLQVLFATNTFHACFKNLYEFTKYTENLNHIKLQNAVIDSNFLCLDLTSQISHTLRFFSTSGLFWYMCFVSCKIKTISRAVSVVLGMGGVSSFVHAMYG